MVSTNPKALVPRLLLAAALFTSFGCERAAGSTAAPGASAGLAAVSSAAPAAVTSGSVSAPGDVSAPPIDTATFAQLFRELSEPDQYFFSDNFVSNETSYLQVVPLLEKRVMRGGAYLGVGPEQNFSYIALSRPSIAFIVDIRRQNAIEHLLYKAIFDQAKNRTAFLCALLGADCKASEAPVSEASFEAVLDHVDSAWKRRDKAEFRLLHGRLRDRIASQYGIRLSKRDQETLENVHRAFFTKGLSIAFELHSENHRTYPTLRELFETKSPGGRARSYLASAEDFRLIQRMQRDNRIIPVVGDFAGDHAIGAIGAELRRRGLPVSVFYTSNVEQYLVDPPKWQRWVRNVEALPTNEASLFLRCYLDQGRRHPQQLEGHRTASVLQTFDHFRWKQRSRGYTGFWQLATDGVITE
jgi:hypothetical protein